MVFEPGRIDAPSPRAKNRTWIKTAVAFATTVAMTIGGLALTAAPASADTSPAAGVAETPTSVPLPTAQINGVAWAQAIVGDTVWVGGEFTNARPAGSARGVNTTPRTNLMAYNLTTGVMTSWNPGANGVIRSITASPDGSRIYVGGTFTTIAGASRNRIAAFSTATGALLPWNPGANSAVSDIATAGNTVWVSGNFTNFAGGSRLRVAAVNASTGALLPFAASPVGGNGVRAIEVNADGTKVVIGGSMESTNGSTNPGRGLAALDSATGASLEWKINSTIRNGGANAAIYSLASDGDSVYGTGYDYYGTAEDGFEGTFRASWTDGSTQWIEDCHGDSYAVAAGGGVVYAATHAHYCGNIGGFPQTSPKWTFNHSLAFSKEYLGNTFGYDPYGYPSYVGNPAATMLQWYPTWGVGDFTGLSQATWDVEANNDYVVYGGEFRTINGAAQEGLVRFGKKSVGAPTGAPQLTGAQWPVSPLSLRAGEIRVSWPANTDRDSETLTYELFRQDKGATPIYSTQEKSNFWTQPDMRFIDTSVTTGTTYQYRVRATDAEGNVATGSWVSVTASTTAASDYALEVLDDGAQHYWPLGENSGSTGTNWAEGSDLAVNAATRGTTGQNLETPSKATTFAGSDTSYAASKKSEPSSDTVSVEAWFNTTSAQGGKIVGFGNAATGGSGSYDRHVYIDGSGRVTYGVYTGASQTLQSSTGFNDGQWHHVVATLGADGMVLYLDGKRVAARTDTTSGQPYTGFWRIGGDNLGGWPNVGGQYLNGSISDVAIYKSVLTRTQVDAHWTASGRTSNIPAAPADAYGKSVFDLFPSLYWRAGETAGSTAADSGAEETTGTYYGDVTKGVTGALTGVANTAIRTNPNGGDQTGISSDKQFSNPTTFALETWFKTDSTSGGKLIGFGNNRTGTSNSYDRHIYMSGDGRVKFGTYTGRENVVESSPGFNDNQWHHVVAQMSSTGMQLYIDGALVSTNANTGAQDYAGYWRVGGDSGWEGDTYWRGSLDEIAVYPAALTAKQVQDHHDLGELGYINSLPTASFSSIATDLAVAFDASTSTDIEGPIASYAWDFGDGQTATGATADHTFAHSGTWNVTLTVTDGNGATGTITQPVTVTGANVAPTSSFTSTVTHQFVTFDGSASSDVDGTIQNYSWAFGDGETGTGAAPSHTYAAAGSYTVTLTVTDNSGGSAVSEQTITTTVAPGTPADAYGAAVYNQSPTLYWRLDEASGSTVRDSGTQDNPGSYYGNVQKGVAGAIAADNTAVSLIPNGGDQTGASSTRRFTNPTTFSIESWFKTDSTSGGKLVSFGVAQTGTSTNHDRSVYMSGDGRVKFGTWTGQMNIVESAPGFNDNAWHHVVAQLSSTGMQLYIDGELVDSDANTQAENYSGYWRVGGDTGWEGDTYWRGAIDEVAIYPATLSAQQVADHFELGEIGFVNAPPTASFTSTPTDLAVAFDGTGSADLDGPIASYAWNFGDGTTGTGATVSHTYAAPGTYQVTLTVTDGQGMTDFVTNQVSVLAANVLPTAAFTSTVDQALKVSVNGTTSSDSDGTISSYAWDFGDTATATGATASHTYGAGGTYTVTLVVTDNRGGTATTTQDVTVALPPNQVPTAAFTSQVTDLEVAVDGSTSTDADGTIASHAWNFGDGGTATGATASHAYTAAGTYTVTLTVTDDDGAIGQKSEQITVTAAPVSNVIAKDAFGRTSSNGWGTADQGGAWAVSPTAARFNVAGGAGVITLLNSVTQQASLSSVSSSSTRLATTFSVDKIANAQYISFIGRQVGSNQYLLRARIATDGSVILHVMRNGTAIGAAYNVPGLTITPGETYNVVFEVKGTSPTALTAKVWRAGTTEPANWQITRSDSTSGYQAAGSVAVSSYVPTSAAAYPVKVSFTGLTVSDPTVQVGNQVPVAAFTSSVSGLSASVDGSSSSDADGTVVSYAWNFGDGGTATGATASRTYAAAG
ncbi:PKD domain-containing protein, partial [Planococcus sp. APC 4015]|nr:PKD domain-containing protein [Planococcus sp. APC 4015]